MKDGSDAIADWPILNALVNTACGAGWVSVHHGGGVGIGYSLHAGMVVVADGSAAGRTPLELVLTSDPATGVIRHVDAGYEEAVRCARGARRGRAGVELLDLAAPLSPLPAPLQRTGDSGPRTRKISWASSLKPSWNT